MGLFRGIASLYRAGRFILSHRAALRLSVVPALLLSVLAIGFSTFGVVWAVPELVALLDLGSHWLATAGTWGLLAIGWLLSIVLGTWLAAAVTPVLASPALESLVRLRQAELGVASHQAPGFVRELLCALQAQLWAWAFLLPPFVVAAALSLLFPPLSPVLAPIKLLLTSLGLAWSLLDYPLTLRGMPARERLKLLRSNLGATLGFGIAFSLLFWLPPLGVVLLPLGVVAATELHAQLQRPDAGL